MGIESIYWVIAVAFVLFSSMLIATIIMFNKIRNKQLIVQQSSDFLLQVAYEDDITGLPTMAKFTIDIAPMFSTALPGEFCIVIFDIDNFKYINDIFGYKTGNRLLRCLAKYLESVLPAQTQLARVNADNFIVLCKSHLLEEVCQCIDGYRIQSFFPEVRHMLGENYTISFSIGTYEVTDTTKDLAVMMDYAAIAKKNGKDTYGTTAFHYTDEMDMDMQLKNKITVLMEKALADNEFMPYLQPQFSFDSGRLVGAEVLARWHSSTLGVVFPSEFIPLFEKNGFICKLDMFMFERSCSLIRDWLDCGLRKIPRISVNASKLTVTRDNYLQSLLEIIERYEIDPSMLEIELTESVLAEKPEEILSVMSQLKQHGFFVSLDDFGKGYSSLNLLKDIPADVLKLDRGFLSETIDTDRGKYIIRCIIDMSKKLRLETVAEGIETLEQVDSLREMGCDIAQGFYFARPMPSYEFERTIMDNEMAFINEDDEEDTGIGKVSYINAVG